MNDKKILLGNHILHLKSKNFLLGADVWQLESSQKEKIKQLFPNNPKLTKLIQIAQILDKHQKEIDYYQTRIRGITETIIEIENKKK